MAWFIGKIMQELKVTACYILTHLSEQTLAEQLANCIKKDKTCRIVSPNLDENSKLISVGDLRRINQ